MKLRRRLSPEEAKSLGLKVKEAESYDSPCKNPRYQVSKEQWNKVATSRKKAKEKAEKSKSLKILVFDLETAPNKAWVWGAWKQNINPQMLINDWWIITWSAKWLFEDEVYSGKVTPKEALECNDKRICESLWKMIDEADILVGHNIAKFDKKKMNTRFLLHDLGSPSSYHMIDTVYHARKQFAFHSNKLDFIAQQLGVGKKLEHEGFAMWEKCMQGDKEAIDAMQSYNDVDVKINEEVYIKMRPFIKPHPNVSLFLEKNKMVCPTCESENLQFNGEYTTYVNTYSEYKCKRCGNSCRANKKHTKLTPLPR
jgi:DNA polymerase elongation subunit (family B)